METILKDYQSKMKDIEGYLNNINTEMGKLREYDLLTLERVNVKSAKIARLVKIVDGTSTALSVISRSSGVIEGFARGMDLFFTQEDSQKLKKESKTRFAQQIRGGRTDRGRPDRADGHERETALRRDIKYGEGQTHAVSLFYSRVGKIIIIKYFL